MQDVRVCEINDKRWSQVQKERHRVTYEEFKIYLHHVWSQWVRFKSKGVKRTVALADHTHVINPTPPQTPDQTPRKRTKAECSQITTSPSSTQKTTDQHDRKRRRPLDNTLKEMFRDYMYNGIVRGMDLKKFITKVESEMALDESSDTMQSLDEGFEAMTRTPRIIFLTMARTLFPTTKRTLAQMFQKA